MKNFKILILLCFFKSAFAVDTCCTPLGQQGVCASLKQCPEVVHLFTALSVSRAKEYATILQRICGYKITVDNYPVVCCSRIVVPQEPTKYFHDASNSHTLTPINVQINIGRFCRTPLDQQGECVSLKYCPEVVNLFTALPVNRAKQYSTVLQRICGFQTTHDNYPVVCCSKVVVNGQNNHSNRGESPQTQANEEITTTPAPTAEDRLNPISGQTRRICLSPDLVNGFCTPLADCEPLFERLKRNQEDEELKRLLRASNKLCQSMGTDVCCSTSNNGDRNSLSSDIAPRRMPTEDEGCGIVRQTTSKVVGGEDSDLGAWPWIALIGYDPYSLAPFKCGGSLITARHVLTAAHCIRVDLSFVRLGEHDLSTDTETTHVDIDVSKMVKHPNFSKDGRNDLAVLFLVKNVDFTDLISPICMPTSPQLRSKSYIRTFPYVAGWGRTMEGGPNSNILQQLQIPILENSVCHQSYQANRRLLTEQQFDSSVICAGILTGGRDTCQGDSGGPLMMPEPYKGITRYYLIGIVSYGIGCARIGVPGVYTSTRYFMDWISEQIANT